MHNKKYILSVAKSKGMKAFIARDAQGNIVLAHDNPCSLTECYQDLVQFMNNTTGLHKIELRSEYGKGVYPKVNNRGFILGQFDIMLDNYGRGMEGFDAFESGGSRGGNLGMVRNYEKEIRELDRRNVKLENRLDNMKEQVRRLKGKHKSKLKKVGSNDHRIKGYIEQFSHLLTPGISKPINGIEGMTETDEKDEKKTKHEKLINAVNRLLAVDPDIGHRLAKLANLAETNPNMYNHAKKVLDSM